MVYAIIFHLKLYNFNKKKVTRKLCNEQVHVVRKDIDVNEHERLSNITLVHKLK